MFVLTSLLQCSADLLAPWATRDLRAPRVPRATKVLSDLPDRRARGKQSRRTDRRKEAAGADSRRVDEMELGIKGKKLNHARKMRHGCCVAMLGAVWRCSVQP
eukprot:3682127-Rhodomonas_salina.2